ncbi:hypothetical protein [Rhodococcoides fascians]|uniref:hypothetical protein n=1 Tax=Rhodococcoides fascians TaxID=1828 RepID=UPI00050C5F8F|nr:hypothetical protein [Rhodococcus fascians]
MSATAEIVDGIDTRLEVLEKPNPITPGWDWIVRFTDLPNSAARRFPNEAVAREYARQATELISSDEWAQLAEYAAEVTAAINEKADNE